MLSVAVPDELVDPPQSENKALLEDYLMLK